MRFIDEIDVQTCSTYIQNTQTHAQKRPHAQIKRQRHERKLAKVLNERTNAKMGERGCRIKRKPKSKSFQCWKSICLAITLGFMKLRIELWCEFTSKFMSLIHCLNASTQFVFIYYIYLVTRWWFLIRVIGMPKMECSHVFGGWRMRVLCVIWIWVCGCEWILLKEFFLELFSLTLSFAIFCIHFFSTSLLYSAHLVVDVFLFGCVSLSPP